MRTPTPLPRRTAALCVFELVNLGRREVYVGTSAHAPSEPLLRGSAFSPRLSHWGAEERVELRIIEERMPRKDAGVFVSGYAASVARAGWTAITD